MRTASRPALRAPPMETVATGTPAGICTMDSNESMPSRYFSGTGTPMTGNGVTDASMPGRCAAPPAPAMMTRIPRPAALGGVVGHQPAGVRCAETTRDLVGHVELAPAPAPRHSSPTSRSHCP